MSIVNKKHIYRTELSNQNPHSVTACLDLTRSRKSGDLLIQETQRYELVITDEEFPFSLSFDD
jgi:hypothetical protein